MMEPKIAIIAVGYNRATSMARLLKSLNRAEYVHKGITLIVSIDNSGDDAVEKYAREFSWKHGEKRVVTYPERLGLRRHIMSFGEYFKEFDALIVLEDDIVVSKGFYSYAEQTVKKYAHNADIAGISLYSFGVNYQTCLPFNPISDRHDAYFMKCAMSWGQVWIKSQWERFYEWYSRQDAFTLNSEVPDALFRWPESSWLKYHTRYCIEECKYFVYPYVSLTTNFSDYGTHNRMDASATYQVPLLEGSKFDYLLPEIGEGVYYDAFFENEALYSCLGLGRKDLCVDLTGGHSSNGTARYWLTTKSLPYKVVKSYGLNYRPIENNVLCNNPGNGIFLYDTRESSAQTNADSTARFLNYNYRIESIMNLLSRYGISCLCKSFFKSVATKTRLIPYRKFRKTANKK